MPDGQTNQVRSWRWAHMRPGLPAVKAETREVTETSQAQQISGSLYRGTGGQFQGGPGTILKKRLEKIRELRKAKGKAKAKPKGKGAGAKPKTSPADKAAENAANRAAVGDVLNANDDERLSKQGLENLNAFAADGTLDPATQEHMVKQGLVKVDRDGVVSLTPEGRKVVAAANTGDANAVGRALDDAGKRVVGAAGRDAEQQAKETARETEKQAKLTAKEQAKADKEKAAPEKKKGGGGGGGGGGKGDKPEEKPAEAEAEAKPDKAAEKAKARAETARATAEAVGLKPAEADALSRAASGGTVDEAEIDGLAEEGLVEADGKGGFITTDAGRRALNALERGDVRGYQAALQDVRGARQRQGERDKAKGERETAKADRDKARTQAKTDRDKARTDKATAKDKERQAKEKGELDDLASDFRRGVRGLSLKEQRRLVKAGRATFDKSGTFGLNATKSAPPWRWRTEAR